MILHGISEFIGNAFTEVLLYPGGGPGSNFSLRFIAFSCR